MTRGRHNSKGDSAFVWENGHTRDLGTLGGPHALAYAINRFGQIAGESYTNDIANGTTGIPKEDPITSPRSLIHKAIDPFVWTDGKMIDLGSLGGTIGVTVCINDWDK